MSLQRLSAKSTRRIEQATGLTIVRAWSRGGSVMPFVTTEHQHGWWDQKTGEWGIDVDPLHMTTCRELFPPPAG